MAIADAYDSIRSDRSYRAGRTHEEAIAELFAHAGTQFDPTLLSRLKRVTGPNSGSVDRRSEGQSVDLARGIGMQIERLVTALDEHDMARMGVLANRLEATAVRHGVNNIASKARDMQDAIGDDCDLYQAIQTATEMLDMCRSTQGILLSQSTQISTATCGT